MQHFYPFKQKEFLKIIRKAISAIKKGGTISGRTENGTSEHSRLHQSRITIAMPM